MDPSRLGRLPPPFSFQPMQPLQEHDHGQQGPSLHNSEEDEYSNSSGQNTMTPSNKGNGNNKGMRKGMGNKAMGEAGEVVRKPRGRPPGSKNKPKPPIIITRETGTGMRPHVLEIASGCDVHECIATFARRRQRSLCVLGASGTVSNVTLRQPTVPPGGNSASVLTLHGRFDILSMSGTFMQPTAPQPLMPMPLPPTSSPSLFGGGGGGGGGGGSNASSPSSMPTCPSSGLTISMAGAQGQVIGGLVVGALMSVSPILVIAASFLGPCAERLPLDEHEQDQHGMLNGNNGGGPGLPPHHLALAAGGSGGGPSAGMGPGSVPNDPCAMSLYNLPQVSLGNQITPDILAWAAAAGGRPPF
ncbi:AT-hook motif nuclear-localized protein 23 [Selaginella moellendorffii]|uniref:AT-hook motif nuclear-localized protein 23 n=1 Tax=Selaginella moellendorffii TaxID=88036 RepID=UPI000D1C60EE|nr:AT-hook motif nuclear-localized protein 23 [Selaginella moellendorffii]|eukprot:XP_024539974.1 AT-hook motif nuclear-localized protein 23 [Selaginella moellendorffii]